MNVIEILHYLRIDEIESDVTQLKQNEASMKAEGDQEKARIQELQTVISATEDKVLP